MGLSLDLWLYHPQLNEVSDLAAAFPNLTIVLNHVGSPILGGPYRGRRDEVFAAWKTSMAEIAKHKNVVLKLGALPIRLPGGTFDRAIPPSSRETETAWRPWLEPCIEMFGPSRCMFESNFPVDKAMCSYVVIWNAFKRLASGCSAVEKAALFHGSAARFYRLEMPG
jgi:predicted TIM-barrel fold metal-dependent hydrolase